MTCFFITFAESLFMKRILLTLLILLSFVSLKAQKRTNDFIEDIKNSGDYFYALGSVANSETKAKEKAMLSLYDNITENIKLSLVKVDTEDHLKKIYLTLGIDKNDNNNSNKIWKILPVTNSFDEYSYFVYVHKNDFDSVCDRRADEMRRYAKKALQSENEEKMVDAFREYYWAMMLCAAHPQGAALKINVDGDDVNAYNYLQESINEVLGLFDFAVAKDNPGEFKEDGLAVILNVRSFGKDVSGLKIAYHNGVDDFNTELVSNGKAQLQLSTTEVDNIDIRIRYDFQYELNSRPELKKIFANIDPIVLRENVRRNIELNKYLQYFKNYEDVASGTVSLNSLNDNEKNMLTMMQEIESAFRLKNYLSVKKYFTKEAYDMLDTLVRNAKISVVGNQQYEFITLNNRVTLCRDIDLRFQFKNYVSFIRELVFRFDNDKKLITSLSFRLDSEAENDIMKKGRWSEDCRYTLLNFMEDYQTAYALKRYDYLESIFSDDALIIVGHVLKRTVLPDQMTLNLSEEEVKKERKDKKTYFENLSRVFAKQEYINIRFAETDFTRQLNSLDANKTGGEDIFGVRLLQEYNSATYGDTGYLFLMVDLRDQERPVIHVRAWQPDKVDVNKLIGLKDLK